MYKPNQKSFANFEELREQGIWEETEKIYRKYQRKWGGPNIPIYIFPMLATNSLFSRQQEVKSGVAFRDKLFLFLTPLADEKELEALIVHEYHHVCRFQKQTKKIEDYTLLDSLVLEGLAEKAVEESCGRFYCAKSCSYYSRKEIIYYWKRYIQHNIHVKKNENIHDQIFYGQKEYPKMLGYAAGYEIVSIYKSKNDFSIKESFQLPSEDFLLEKEKLL